MRVLITGVGDAFTCRHFSTSAAVDAPQGVVLIDCPDLIHRVLANASSISGWSVNAADVTDIILTHLHGDHCNGLESFGFARRYDLQQRSGAKPRIHTSEPVAERLWERLAPAMDGRGSAGGDRRLEDFFDVHTLRAGEPSQVAGLEIRCRFTGHPVPTIGLMINDGERTLGWSGDTPYEQAHIDWLSGADLIVHECNRGAAHTPIEDLNVLPDDLRQRMRLIHLPDDFDPDCTDIHALVEGELLVL